MATVKRAVAVTGSGGMAGGKDVIGSGKGIVGSGGMAGGKGVIGSESRADGKGVIGSGSRAGGKEQKSRRLRGYRHANQPSFLWPVARSLRFRLAMVAQVRHSGSLTCDFALAKLSA